MSTTRNSNIYLSGPPIEQSQQTAQTGTKPCDYTCLDLKPGSRDLLELKSTSKALTNEQQSSFLAPVLSSSSSSSPLGGQNYHYSSLYQQGSLVATDNQSQVYSQRPDQPKASSSAIRGLKRPSNQIDSNESLSGQQQPVQSLRLSVNLHSDTLQQLIQFKSEEQPALTEPKGRQGISRPPTITKQVPPVVAVGPQETEEEERRSEGQGDAEGSDAEEGDDESSFNYQPVLCQILNEKKLVSMLDSFFCQTNLSGLR